MPVKRENADKNVPKLMRVLRSHDGLVMSRGLAFCHKAVTESWLAQNVPSDSSHLMARDLKAISLGWLSRATDSEKLGLRVGGDSLLKPA